MNEVDEALTQSKKALNYISFCDRVRSMLDLAQRLGTRPSFPSSRQIYSGAVKYAIRSPRWVPSHISLPI